MENYSEKQKKEDLAVFDIKEDTHLSSEWLTSKFKKLAKIHHPDKGGTKEAFQKLQNAYDRLTAMTEKCESKETDSNYEKEFFKTSNFPFEKKNCFVVVLENRLSDQWEYVFKDLYGTAKVLETGGVQFKVGGMTLSFYNKPKKDNKTKLLIQGKDKNVIIEYVFERMPKVYGRVLEMSKAEQISGKKSISCDNCDYKSNNIPILQDHIEEVHLIPYRKKIQQKLIAAYKCEECDFAVPTRSSLRTHVNTKHRMSKHVKLVDDCPTVKSKEEPIPIKIVEVKQLVCKVCELVLESKKKCIQHEQSHDIDKYNVANQLIEELLCKVGEQISENGTERTSHMKNLHSIKDSTKKDHLMGLESLFSCDQCDFDTDDS